MKVKKQKKIEREPIIIPEIITGFKGCLIAGQGLKFE